MELYIATPFRRPNAPVELKNPNGSRTQYFFKPCDQANPNSEHVALVKDRDHISKLLSLDGGKAYTIAEYQPGAPQGGSAGRPEPAGTAPGNIASTASELAAAATSAAIDAAVPPAAAAAPQVIEGTAPRANEPQIQTTTARDAEAVALLAMPLKDFKAALAKTPLLVCGAALVLEDSKDEANKRPTYIKALNDRLKKG